MSFNGSSDVGWTPIPELIRTDADVTIIFLAQNQISYEAPVRDPWFMATTSIQEVTEHLGNETLFIQDDPIRVLGCADQYQLCIQAHTKCTPLTGADALTDAIKAIPLNDVQKDIWILLNNVIPSQTTYVNVNFRVSNALRASDKLSIANAFQVGLPNNQWMIEIAYWFDISMARLQQQVIDFATGPLYSNQSMLFVPGPRNACGRQKIHNTTNYTSFSVFGITIVLSIGGLLIITSLVLDSVVGYFRKTYDWKDYKRLQWAKDEQLELQRLAYPTDEQAVEEKGENSDRERGNAVSPEAVTLDTTSGTTSETNADTEAAPAHTNILAKKRHSSSRLSFKTV